MSKTENATTHGVFKEQRIRSNYGKISENVILIYA